MVEGDGVGHDEDTELDALISPRSSPGGVRDVHRETPFGDDANSGRNSDD